MQLLSFPPAPGNWFVIHDNKQNDKCLKLKKRLWQWTPVSLLLWGIDAIWEKQRWRLNNCLLANDGDSSSPENGVLFPVRGAGPLWALRLYWWSNLFHVTGPTLTLVITTPLPPSFSFFKKPQHPSLWLMKSSVPVQRDACSSGSDPTPPRNIILMPLIMNIVG